VFGNVTRGLARHRARRIVCCELEEMKLVRAFTLFLVVCVAIAACCALGGVLFMYFHGGTTYARAIGWAMWIGGGVLVLLVGGSGSTTRMAGESRIVVGGRFVLGSDIPQPQSPFILIPAGLLVIALGVLIYVAG
jgi:hypothetical protein